MKILIDGRILGSALTGVERYLLELMASFSSDEGRSGREFAVLVGESATSASIPLPAVAGDVQKALLADHDVFHRPFQISDQTTIVELASARASVLTVHDLIAYHYGGYWENEERFLSYRRHFALGLGVVDRIISVSEANRRDLLNAFAVDEERIEVVHHGVNPRFRVIDDQAARESFRHRHGLPPDYLLAIGASYPHKNRYGLLRAFARLREVEPEARLVLAGAPSRQTRPEEDELMARLIPNVMDLGVIPDQDLVNLYNCARLFVYPSLYEGFGLPILEAFACGVPVICSNRSSLPEVAGDAALLVETTEIEGFSEALVSLYRDQSRRRELSAAGFRRAAKFTWERSAEHTLEVYSRAHTAAGEARARIDHRVRSHYGGVAQASKTLTPIEASVTAPKSFTIAVCTHNRASRLAGTLASLTSLEHTGIVECEILVVDNGSTDATRAVIEGVSAKSAIPVRYVYEEALGLSRARNRAVKESRNEIIVFLDDDIEAPPEFLDEYRQAWSRWPQADCLGGKVELEWLVDRPGWLSEELSGLLGRTICEDIERAWRAPTFFIIGCNMSFRREVFERVGGFNPALGYQGATLIGNEENDLMNRIDASGGLIVFSPHPRLKHLIDRGKLTRRYFLRRYYYQGVSDVLVGTGTIETMAGNREHDLRRRRYRLLRAIARMLAGRYWMTDLAWTCYHHGRLSSNGASLAGLDQAPAARATSGDQPTRPDGVEVLQPERDLLTEIDRIRSEEDLRLVMKGLARDLLSSEMRLSAMTRTKGWHAVSVLSRWREELKSILRR